MKNINNYLEETDAHLGVELERYGGLYRAILAHRDNVNFLFELLDGGEIEGIEIQSFFADNPLFPSDTGKTPTKALAALNIKLGKLYEFSRSSNLETVQLSRKFKLVAEHDIEPDEEQTYYDVNWDDIVDDLQDSNNLYIYSSTKEETSAREKRHLHSLVNFQYSGELLNI